MTNKAEPVIANGNCPDPPKYTAPAIDTAAALNTAATRANGGLLVLILQFYAPPIRSDNSPTASA